MGTAPSMADYAAELKQLWRPLPCANIAGRYRATHQGARMRAAVFEGVGKPLAIRELPEPAPQPDQVVIRVARCGVCGSDLHMTEDPHASYRVGITPGHEMAGEVVALGSGVSRLKIGDRVTATSIFGCGSCAACRAGDFFGCPAFQADPPNWGLAGGFGQYTVAPERHCIVLPRTLSLADGALVEPLACSLHGVLKARLDPGARVLVLGAGAVGLGAVFWARRLGAAKVAVAARSHRGEELAMRLGATAFLASEQERAAQVVAALGGAPDVVFECVGRPGLINEAMTLAGLRATVVVLGLCAQADTSVPVIGTMKELELRFATTYTLGEFEHAADALDRGAPELREMCTGTTGLDALPEAFEALRQPNVHCKLMVDPWS
jgi:(R,R)-butanediol dehydrogenase/meso-butanediol dehydrogenase/diacetyl reductase